MAASESDSLMTAIGAIGAGCIITIGMWLRSYLVGRAESASEVHGKHVILEQAELRDFGALPQQLGGLGTKLDQAMQIDQASKTILEENSRRMEETLRILRRMEGELELAKRMREEELLRVRRREDDT